IPFSFPFRPVLDRFAAVTAWIIENSLYPSYSKQFSVYIGNRWFYTVTSILVHPIQFQHLHLHPAWQPILGPRKGIAPDKYPRVASSFHMAPFNMQNEIFVLLLRTHHANWQPLTDQQIALPAPGIRLGIDIDPFN